MLSRKKIYVFARTDNICYGTTISESSGRVATGRGKIDTVRRRISLGQCEYIVIIASINEGVSEKKRSETEAGDELEM